MWLCHFCMERWILFLHPFEFGHILWLLWPMEVGENARCHFWASSLTGLLASASCSWDPEPPWRNPVYSARERRHLGKYGGARQVGKEALVDAQPIWAFRSYQTKITMTAWEIPSKIHPAIPRQSSELQEIQNKLFCARTPLHTVPLLNSHQIA